MKLVFDVGQVLVRWDPMPVLEEILGGPAALAAFHEVVDFPALHGEQDRGRSVAAAVAWARVSAPEYADALKAFYGRWLDTIPFAIEESVALLESRVAAGEPVYGITNFPGELWRPTVEAYPFLGKFADVVVSGDEGVVKPDPSIFGLFLERNGLEPGDCLFFDDSERNVEAARAAGIDAVLFIGPEVLQPALLERGLA
ncbi:MAG: HAD-IA family hydrolase [Pseudomonadota bacterium]